MKLFYFYFHFKRIIVSFEEYHSKLNFDSFQCLIMSLFILGTIEKLILIILSLYFFSNL